MIVLILQQLTGHTVFEAYNGILGIFSIKYNCLSKKKSLLYAEIFIATYRSTWYAAYSNLPFLVLILVLESFPETEQFVFVFDF